MPAEKDTKGGMRGAFPPYGPALYFLTHPKKRPIKPRTIDTNAKEKASLEA
jgi:hypothetical protein